jgi:antitoxin component YwqK of YwqJK toxin-antitoxin module
MFMATGCSSKTTPACSQNDLFHPVQYSEALSSINLIDRNGLSETITAAARLKSFQKTNFLAPQPYQKVLRIFAKDAHGLAHSIITSYHPNGAPRQYLEITQGRAHGQYCEWYPNGEKKLLATLISGAPDIDERSQLTWSFEGTSSAWDEEGTLVAQIPYLKGEMHGKACYFHKNGALAKEVPYTKGQIDGIVRAWNDTGDLLEETHYVSGDQDGASFGFWRPSCPKWQEEFQDGLLGTGKYFSRDGNVLSEVSAGQGKRVIFDEKGVRQYCAYQDGEQEGAVSVVEEDATISSCYFVHNGQKHGTETCYWPPKPFASAQEKEKLRPKIAIDWFEGKIQGLVKTWYENGIQESQREMSNNMKQGTLSAWYRDGSLMLIEEYEKDKLIRGEYLKKGESTPVSKIKNGNGIAALFDAEGNFNKRVSYQNGTPSDDVAR